MKYFVYIVGDIYDFKLMMFKQLPTALFLLSPCQRVFHAAIWRIS